ncbi:MAG: glycosyltransferase family 39 protein [Candidatus Levybacteria bacterium]|nr:glycosyltransferase family 39 protein [Candidatus Levybacteria bacterium]
MKRFITFLPVIVLIVLSYWSVSPLLEPGFFSIHDDEQVGRLYELDQSIKSGHFPVRISQNLGFGYGYPLFNFYPPFVYYVAEVFVLFGIGYIASVELMIGLGFLLAAYFMYIFSKEYLGKYGGLVAAVVYTYVPYHAVDVYVRGALPEFWSFVFVPAIFWAYKKLADTKKPLYLILSGIFFTCLILTHNLVAMMSGIFIAMYLLFLLWETTEKKRFMQQVALSGLIGLTLSASFWIPSFFERNTTMIKLLTMESADYNQHYVYLRQLWNSAWGYGGSLPGPEDGLTFQIGKVHIIGSILAGIAGLWLYLKKNTSWKILFLFIAMFSLATFMMTFHSDFVWDNLQFFAYIQFPWRFLLFTAFASSFLVGALVLVIKSERIKAIVAAVLMIGTVFFYKDYFTPKEYFKNVTDTDYINLDVIKWKTSIMAFEYVPNGVATKETNFGTKIDITKEQVATSSYTVIKGDIRLKEESIKPHYKKYFVSGSGGIVRINQFSYPGWNVFIDMNEVTYSDNNRLKLLQFNVPSGNHSIEVKYTDTPARMLGNVLSATSIIGILLYIILILLRKNKTSHHGKNKKRKNK